ncbi:hypothetical protein E3U23_04690 [Erythrobacter litoralis]|uniref:KAP family P-loop NTPase fold protein n=1 Tax=Erythrobacter litoralis TaxID=39960 RepID=UPI0024350BFD|nr:P-loop NTPase fold protein [Erythrobacter litoralis]MDG6078489.1 hypothetical protein [Erythrobacter litoralis]
MQRSAPIRRIDDDELGLSNLAIHLATTLDNLNAKSGFVLGISGGWGTGKTSLLNMIFAYRERITSSKDAVITISPWAIPPGDDVVGFFLSEFARQLREFANDNGGKAEGAWSELRNVSHSLSRFAQKLRPATNLARFAGKMGVPGGSLVADAMDVFSENDKAPSFAKMKKNISDALLLIDSPIFVIVDDLDRIEPERVSDILTTVRAIADFPNLIYILLYDRDKISHSVRETLKYKDGQDFLEKIVQFELLMPAPESFALRRMFRKKLALRLAEIGFDIAISDSQLIESVIGRWGSRYITNPRRLDQAIDYVLFLLGNHDLYLPDAIFVSILKAGCSPYYEWLEQYLISFSVVAVGKASLTDNHEKNAFDRLKEILSKENLDLNHELLALSSIVPGINRLDANSDTRNHLFNTEVRVLDAGRLQRIGSPDHYRIYFANTFSSDAPDQELFSSLISSMESEETISDLLLSAFDQEKVDQIEACFNRLAGERQYLMSEKGAASLFKAMTIVGDHSAVTSKIDELFREPLLWPEARRVFKYSHPKMISPAELQNLFRESPSIGWMTSVLRSETFSHGRVNDQKDSEKVWILSEDQLDYALNGFNERLKLSKIDDLIGSPVFNQIIFAWAQGGYAHNVRAFIKRETAKIEDFFRFLEAFDTGGSGDHRVITRESCLDILDFDKVVERLRKLQRIRKFSARSEKLLKKLRVAH